jgi:hypothetical protein
MSEFIKLNIGIRSTKRLIMFNSLWKFVNFHFLFCSFF